MKAPCPDTASAGELVAVAFKSIENTRFIGQPTAGYSTNTEEFPLSDGSALFLATSYYTDSKGNKYTNGLTPDTLIEDVDSQSDLVLEGAKSWILND